MSSSRPRRCRTKTLPQSCARRSAKPTPSFPLPRLLLPERTPLRLWSSDDAAGIHPIFARRGRRSSHATFTPAAPIARTKRAQLAASRRPSRSRAGCIFGPAGRRDEANVVCPNTQRADLDECLIGLAGLVIVEDRDRGGAKVGDGRAELFDRRALGSRSLQHAAWLQIVQFGEVVTTEHRNAT